MFSNLPFIGNTNRSANKSSKRDGYSDVEEAFNSARSINTKEILEKNLMKLNQTSSELFSGQSISHGPFSSSMDRRTVISNQSTENETSAMGAKKPYQMVDVPVVRIDDKWSDYNCVYIHTTAPINEGYAELTTNEYGRENITIVVRVLKREDAQLNTIHLSQTFRTDLRLSINSKINLREINPPPSCWDRFALHITAAKALRQEFKNTKITKTPVNLANAFIQQCKKSGCVLVDSHTYVFSDSQHNIVAQVRLESSGEGSNTGGLLTNKANITNVTTTKACEKSIVIAGTIPGIDVKKLSKKFEFDGDRYAIGGANDYIKQFVSEFISPRLLSVEIQERMNFKIPRGGILSGPPGTGKTLFVKVIESVLKENGFEVSSKFVAGPEFLNKYVGASEENIRALFEDKSISPSTIRLILIDEVDSMLKRRSGTGNSVHDSMVNQFLTCLDGIEKKNNLIVFGTTNRVDLIDPAVMRPGRMSAKMEFTLPDMQQRLQILQILTRQPRENGDMLVGDVSLKDLATRTRGFTGAELGDLIQQAGNNAIRRKQGLREDDMHFNPESLPHMDTLEICDDDFVWALKQVKPQFGKSIFMPMTGKTFASGGYPEQTIKGLKEILDNFSNSQKLSAMRILIKGPAGSGKSTLAALAHEEFGKLSKASDAFCSHVSAIDIVKSQDRRAPVVNAFSERDNHKGAHDMRYTVILDDFDTMINYDGLHYDHAIVSTMDAYTKQSLQGISQGKLLTLVTVTEHEGDACAFLPRLFSDDCVFKTRSLSISKEYRMDF